MPDITRRGRADASKYLEEKHGVIRSPTTLAKLAVIGGGPKFRKVGTRQVIYEQEDLDAWVESILSARFGSTSELAA